MYSCTRGRGAGAGGAAHHSAAGRKGAPHPPGGGSSPLGRLCPPRASESVDFKRGSDRSSTHAWLGQTPSNACNLINRHPSAKQEVQHERRWQRCNSRLTASCSAVVVGISYTVDCSTMSAPDESASTSDTAPIRSPVRASPRGVGARPPPPPPPPLPRTPQRGPPARAPVGGAQGPPRADSRLGRAARRVSELGWTATIPTLAASRLLLRRLRRLHPGGLRSFSTHRTLASGSDGWCCSRCQ